MCSEPRLSREESEEFISRVLRIDLPSCYPPSLDWINELVRAFQRHIPFQNISFLSKDSHDSVPTWEEIYKEIIVEGKGGLCLSLNVAFAAVLSSLGTTAYNVSADYIAGEGRGVHALTIIHYGDIPVNKNSIVTRSRTGNRGSVYYNYDAVDSEKDYIKRYGLFKVPEKFLYLVDVGCGYPTLRAINLKNDLGKVYFDCGLEYCIIKRGHRYLRMHRRGHDLDEVEKKCVNNDGWLPMFSFRIVPKPLSCFQLSMRSIYVYQATSSYFQELHAVLYFSQTEMIAVKNEQLIRYLGQEREESIPGPSSKSRVNDSDGKVVDSRNRLKLKQSELTEELLRNFPMIPKWEVEKAVLCYTSLNKTAGLV
ncbi:uncharacterized protein [Palaemon carinicauda]|uniref:uncharacterized protein n=1 Tax=Palaemon carinicauda TaxID=392227 RepID=UPI0035B59D5E